MRFRWTWIAASMLSLGLMLSTASAQISTSDDGKRKVKVKVAPIYPDIARRMSVACKVKIEVIITPDGKVRSTRVVGGHPLLVQACQDAVKEWKFFPAPEESTQTVEFDFRANN